MLFLLVSGILQEKNKGERMRMGRVAGKKRKAERRKLVVLRLLGCLEMIYDSSYECEEEKKFRAVNAPCALGLDVQQLFH